MTTLLPLALLCLAAVQDAPTFERIRLSDEFHAEGGSFADLDRDGHADVIVGPYWYAGPDFARRHALRAPRPFDPAGYSDSFFCWPRDFDGDGWVDLLFVGFPGQDASVYRNPGDGGGDGGGRWEVHEVLDAVDGESPAFADLTGDGEPELVCIHGGRFGWAAPGEEGPLAPWTFHPLSPDLGLGRFTHGLGVGDLDGDGRADLLEKTGWWRQPESLDGDPVWEKHDVAFAGPGGAQMFAYDVDGDGDADVVTSLAAHGFGLAWFEQVPDAAGGIAFERHMILGEGPDDRTGGVQVAELHALDLIDFDGDGLLDVVTGKRWWSHGAEGDPMPGAPAAVYWLELVRDADAPGGARFVPHLVDDDSGVGTQVVAGDVNGDGRVDVVVGNKKGAFAILQRAPGEPHVQRAVAPVDVEPFVAEAVGLPVLGDDGEPLNLGFETGDLTDWVAEGEAFAGQPIEGDTVSARGREPSLHQGAYWVGGYELDGDGPTGTLRSAPFRIAHPWASFLVAGGAYESTRVELRDAESDALLFRSSGASYESLQRVVVDLRRHVGERAVIVLVDEASGGWGHLNFDDFRFHAEEPAFERPEGVPEILPLDVVANAGLGPAEAARAMDLPEGFRVELIAAEPDLQQPVALSIDARGRLWVAEAFSYPVKRPEGEGEDTIVVFEDRDADGSFETRTVFAEGLDLVSGLAVGHGGVFVGAAPELLFLPDRDDDLVPDGPPEVLLDGWGYEDTHETLNAFTWGPDGWLYGCHGVFTHSRVGAPGTPDAERVPLNAGVWRYHPKRRAFEVFAWGTSNPWGVTFDGHGQAFVTACVIPHLFHMVQGGRYARQAGRHFGEHVYADIPTIADHRHYLGATPHSGNLRSNAVGGGHAHCGALIYLGDAFPERYRGAILMNNIHGNRVNVDLLERAGSGFVGHHGEDLLLANDRWFRGISLRQGPSGAVYLSDWYDAQACHLTQPEVWDRTNGRLYRISYGAPVAAGAPDLRGMGSAELAAALLATDEYLASRARLVLAERGPSAEVRAQIDRLLAGERTQRETLSLLWALHVTEQLDPTRWPAFLASEHEYVRAWTVQLACEGGDPGPDLRAAMLERARTDPSPVVRLYLASALQRLPVDVRLPIAAALARHAEDAADPNLPLLLWYGLEPVVAADPQAVLELALETPLERLRAFVFRRAAAEPGPRAALVALLDGASPFEREILAETSAALEGELSAPMPAGWPAVAARLLASGDEELRERALWLSATFGDRTAFPELAAVAADAGAGPERRGRAVEALVRGRYRDAVGLFTALLDDPALRGRAVRALAAFDEPATADVLLERYEGFGPEERRDAVGTLGSRPAWARALLRAVRDGRVPAQDVGAFALRQLGSHGDAEVDALVAELWVQRPTGEEAAQRIAELTELLTDERLAAADRAHGRALFSRTCSQCHTLFDAGGDLAPDLTGSNRRDLEYLLTNLVDPNAVIGKDYQVSIALLHDGRIVSGIETARSESAVTLRSERETVVLGLDEIELLKLSEVSTMPEGQLDVLSEQEIVDLVAYVQGDEQVALRATPDDAALLFDGLTLAGWTGASDVWSVEDGELVGRTEAGLARNEFLRSDLLLGDFRLSFEVRLVGDEGNSGVQFRSRALAGGDVAGYQADIGPGWWGKLYEEHGRALLWERSGEEAVVADGWNRYVVEAIGGRVRTWINGVACVDLDDPDGAREGILALQVHSGGPTEVRFRAFELELDPAPSGSD